ncbi:hypothetical protein [Parasphingopyxis sp.]|uniref:hypothetical protein n=1 Tax=Parasphingopyxis sp. TaxID=1920299 RepID=UPI0026309F3A|nr:hypothetical protein [Parasphingopyxis sp.]
MSFPVKTDYRRWRQKQYRYSPQDFLALDRLPSGLILIEYGAVELAMLIKNRHAEASFFGFHAAQSPVMRQPVPYFQGRKVAPKRLNQILVCDPSLYLDEDVRVGWFFGNKYCNLVEELPPIMDKIDALTGATRRLLWGNSAGGTAALRYARDQDVSVVMNPQIILRNFTWSRVEPWLLHAWDLDEYWEGRDYGARHCDLRDTPPKGRIVYCQNEHDDHVELQLEPLAEILGVSTEPGDDGRFKLILGDWGKGHIPPPSEVQQRIVGEEVARMLGKPDGLLARLGFGH